MYNEKRKKLLATALTAIMAVSAMSVSAMACDNPDDAVVSALAPDGKSMIYLSDEDLDNGINTIECYRGIILTAGKEESSDEAGISLFSSMSTTNFNATSVPTSVRSIDGGIFSGDFSVPSRKARYSRYMLSPGSSSAVRMLVKPDSNFGRKVDFNMCLDDGTIVVTLSPSGTATHFIEPRIPYGDIYVQIDNTSSTTASGYLELEGIN